MNSLLVIIYNAKHYAINIWAKKNIFRHNFNKNLIKELITVGLKNSDMISKFINL